MEFKPKTEWPNCPQWLLDADTENEQVHVDEVGYVTRKGGTWHTGLWKNGTWKNGTWKAGTWVNGTWCNGIWKNGTWENGTWYNGTWKKGVTGLRSKYSPRVTESGSVEVGCQEKTPAEWREWLDGTEEYGTPRGTEAFAYLRAHILATCLYAEELEKYLKTLDPKGK